MSILFWVTFRKVWLVALWYSSLSIFQILGWGLQWRTHPDWLVRRWLSPWSSSLFAWFSITTFTVPALPASAYLSSSFLHALCGVLYNAPSCYLFALQTLSSQLLGQYLVGSFMGSPHSTTLHNQVCVLCLSKATYWIQISQYSGTDTYA